MQDGVSVTTFVVSLITAILGAGGLGALIRALAVRREISVRGELQIVDSVLDHNETLRQDASRLGDKVMEMDQLVGKLRRQNMELSAKLTSVLAQCEAVEETIAGLRRDNQRLIERCKHLEKQRDLLAEQVHDFNVDFLDNQDERLSSLGDDSSPASDEAEEDEPEAG